MLGPDFQPDLQPEIPQSPTSLVALSELLTEQMLFRGVSGSPEAWGAVRSAQPNPQAAAR